MRYSDAKAGTTPSRNGGKAPARDYICDSRCFVVDGWLMDYSVWSMDGSGLFEVLCG